MPLRATPWAASSSRTRSFHGLDLAKRRSSSRDASLVADEDEHEAAVEEDFASFESLGQQPYVSGVDEVADVVGMGGSTLGVNQGVITIEKNAARVGMRRRG